MAERPKKGKPCTQETKRCRYNKYKKNFVTPKCCKKNLIKMLLHFDAVAKKIGLTYFLDFGTLLGCARDGTFIPHDTDIDISILFIENHLFERMFPYFVKRGYVLESKNEDMTFYKLYYSPSNSLHIDIHLRKKNESDVYYSHYSIENWGISENDLFPLTFKIFESASMPVPNNYLKYLQHGYGPDCVQNIKRKTDYVQKY